MDKQDIFITFSTFPLLSFYPFILLSFCPRLISMQSHLKGEGYVGFSG